MFRRRKWQDPTRHDPPARDATSNLMQPPHAWRSTRVVEAVVCVGTSTHHRTRDSLCGQRLVLTWLDMTRLPPVFLNRYRYSTVTGTKRCVGRDQTAVGWWEWMVVRFVCVIRVPVTVPCVSRLPRCLFTGTYETTSLPVYR